MNAMPMSHPLPAAFALTALLALVPHFAAAAAPAPEVDAASLAAADSLLQLCTAMPGGQADVIRRQIALLEQGRGQDELAQARGSGAYRTAWQSTTETLGKVDDQELKKVCAVNDAVKP